MAEYPIPLNTVTSLRTVRGCVDRALEALADEREGDFTSAILALEEQAIALGNLVRTW